MFFAKMSTVALLARAHVHVSMREISEDVAQLSVFTCSWKLQCGGYLREKCQDFSKEISCAI